MVFKGVEKFDIDNMTIYNFFVDTKWIYSILQVKFMLKELLNQLRMTHIYLILLNHTLSVMKIIQLQK